MINLQHSFENIDLPNGDKATLVGIPEHNLNQGEKIIDDYLKEIGHERNDIKKRHVGGDKVQFETWGEYLTDWVKIWQSVRKYGTVDIKNGKTDYGNTYWDSFATCIMTVSAPHYLWLIEKLNDFNDKVTPDIDNLTAKKASQLVENVLKKKNMDAYLDSFRWTGLRSYITVLEKELLRLQDLNLQNTSFIEEQKKLQKSYKNTKVRE